LLLRSGEALEAFKLASFSVTVDTWSPATSTFNRAVSNPMSAEVVDSNYDNLGKTKEAPPIETLLVCTKAPDTLNAIKPLQQRLNSNSVIVLLQNGVLGVHELLTMSYDAPFSGQLSPTFILGSTTHGVTKPDRFRIQHVGVGNTVFGTPEVRS
jgi:ketopantoate reductase